MGLHRSGGNFELLDVLSPNMNDLVDVLEGAVYEQEFGIGDQRAVGLVEVWVDDGIGDAGLVLEREKDEAVRGAGPLPGDDLAGDAELEAMARQLQICCTEDLQKRRHAREHRLCVVDLCMGNGDKGTASRS